MDALKRELARKRKAVESDFGGAKYMKREDLERKKLELIKAEEEQERQRKLKLQELEKSRKQQLTDLQQDKGKTGAGNRWAVGFAEKDVPSKTGESSEADDRIEKLQLSRQEVFRRLRMLKHPVTLFGEDDDDRLERLKHLMRTGDVNPDGELLEGQRNDFLRDMEELKRGGGGGGGVAEKSRQGERGKKDKTEGESVNRAADGGGMVENDEGDWEGGPRDEDEDEIDAKRMKANFEDLGVEDRILVFFKKLLREWKYELDMKPEAERRTIRGKKDFATYKQCARYLEPLFKMCRRKHLDDDIQEALLFMVNKCRERDYLAATDKYIKLAIGNAPWPIGVTMVGIHERSAREKIHTNSVAHIMNDETTRKYLQSVKRLMTLCQRRYPALPSKSVEFNSLANGSDLESLLQEESKKGGRGGQAALLRLTATKSTEDDEFD